MFAAAPVGIGHGARILRSSSIGKERTGFSKNIRSVPAGGRAERHYAVTRDAVGRLMDMFWGSSRLLVGHATTTETSDAEADRRRVRPGILAPAPWLLPKTCMGYALVAILGSPMG